MGIEWVWSAAVVPRPGSTASEGCGPLGERGAAQRGTGKGGVDCTGGGGGVTGQAEGEGSLYKMVGCLV